MFCSNCGKTMPANEKKCRYCGLEIIDSSFFVSTLTSCQPKNQPGEEFEASGKYANVTRTVFTGGAGRADDYGGTTYRTAYVPEEEAPEEAVPETENAAETPAEETAPVYEAAAEETAAEEDGALNEPGDEELTDESRAAIESDMLRLDALKMRPIEATAPKGISRGVREYMEAMREEDKQAQFKPKGKSLRRQDEDEDEADDEDDDEIETAAAAAGNGSVSSAMDDDDDDEAPAPRRSGRKKSSGKKKSDISGIMRVIGVAVLIIAVLAGVITGIAVITKKSEKSPIPGVSVDMYNKGTALIKTRVTSDYKKECLSLYSTGILDFTAKLESDKNEVAALEEGIQDVYDSQFVEALNVIETNINNALTMDALATLQTDPDAQTQAIADSNQRWATINESVEGLLNATTTVEIEAIIRGEKIEIPKETPKPTATPVVYTTLSKGMKVAAVTDLQTRLTQLGFFDDEIDGAYGNKTVTAVKLFQSAAGLEVTGTADAMTLEAVYDDNAPRTGSKVTPEPADEPAAPAPEG